MKAAGALQIPPDEEDQDSADFRACMAYVREHAAGEVEGLFGPASVSWTIFREPGMLLGGLAAVLLQLAHPAVASGVGEHSNFRQDVLGRAQRTSTSMYQLIFGSLEQATAMSRRLYRVHRLVRGKIDAPGAASHGQVYRANERPLLLWVASTVGVSAKLAFEEFVRPLREDERRLWYPEVVLGGAGVGVRADSQPATEAAFDAWYEEMVTSDVLRVSPAARSIADALFRSPYSGGSMGAILTAGLLPARVREAYELPWGRWERGTYRALRGSLRGAWGVVRAPYRYAVAWHQAELRLARARGERAPWLGRGMDTLGRRLGIPTSLGKITDLAGVGTAA